MINNVVHIIWLKPQQYDDLRDVKVLSTEDDDYLVTQNNEKIRVR